LKPTTFGSNRTTDQIEIELSARCAQVENVALRPTVSACERVHVEQEPARPSIEFSPEERADVESLLPAMRAGGATHTELYVGLRLGARHLHGQPPPRHGRAMCDAAPGV